MTRNERHARADLPREGGSPVKPVAEPIIDGRAQRPSGRVGMVVSGATRSYAFSDGTVKLSGEGFVVTFCDLHVGMV